MSQVNNLTGLIKIRPPKWREGIEINSYLTQVETWIRQVTDNLRGVSSTKAYTVADLPPPTDYNTSIDGRAYFIYVSDESGGPQMAFSDGTNWRRFTDRAIVS